MNTLESCSEKVSLSIKEQREKLLEANPDTIYGVYELVGENEDEIELRLVEDVVCMYPNKIPNLKGYDENSDISIIDIGALRKGEVKYLKGGEKTLKNPVLLSSGVIELYRSKLQDREHIFLTLRDGNGGADNEEFTSIAGRCSGDDVNEEVEREQAEESPFLLQNEKGDYYLGVKSLDPEFIKNLEASIDNFIEKIDLGRKNYEHYKNGEFGYYGGNDHAEKTYNQVNMAEIYVKQLFPQVGSLEELVRILQEIRTGVSENSENPENPENLENPKNPKRYVQYKSEEITSYPGAEENFRTIRLNNSEGRFFVYFDKNNNTIEYRAVQRVHLFEEGYRLAGRSTSRLYLESYNQRPNTISATNKPKKVVPTVQEAVKVLLGRTLD